MYAMQGSTAEPGMIAHWVIPRRMPADIKWLVVYVMLSRPRSLTTLKSFGLTTEIRRIIEGGPPQELLASFKHAFGSKPEQTKSKAQQALIELGWDQS